GDAGYLSRQRAALAELDHPAQALLLAALARVRHRRGLWPGVDARHARTRRGLALEITQRSRARRARVCRTSALGTSLSLSRSMAARAEERNAARTSGLIGTACRPPWAKAAANWLSRRCSAPSKARRSRVAAWLTAACSSGGSDS